jgi:hypothetical protein
VDETSKIRWMKAHLDRTPTTLRLPVSIAEAHARLNGALVINPYSSTLTKGDRVALRQQGFVTGVVLSKGETFRFKLRAYRAREWLGRATPVVDQNVSAKPSLVGTIQGDESQSEIEYRVDAFGTAVSAFVLLFLGVPMVIAGVVISLLQSAPMPNLGFVLLGFGFVCLVIVLVIWQVTPDAIRDDEFLSEWLPGVFNAENNDLH